MDWDGWLEVIPEIEQYMVNNPAGTALDVAAIFDLELSDASIIITDILEKGIYVRGSHDS